VRCWNKSKGFKVDIFYFIPYNNIPLHRHCSQLSIFTYINNNYSYLLFFFLLKIFDSTTTITKKLKRISFYLNLQDDKTKTHHVRKFTKICYCCFGFSFSSTRSCPFIFLMKDQKTLFLSLSLRSSCHYLYLLF